MPDDSLKEFTLNPLSALPELQTQALFGFCNNLLAQTWPHN